MIKTPAISIIIPVFNSGTTLNETLASIEAQTYCNWECILIDDGSQDSSLEIIRTYTQNDDRFKLLIRPYNSPKGANTCRNFGFKKSSGNYIQWFDSDDLMHKDMLKFKRDRLLKSQADFVVCEGVIFQDYPANAIGKWDKLNSTSPLLDHAIGNINFQTNAPMFNRKFLENMSLWNEKLQRKQDYEFFSRVLTKGPKFEVLHKNLFFYRVHIDSINSKNYKNSLISMIRADILVFKNLQRIEIYNNKMPEIRKHFLRKIIGKLKNVRVFEVNTLIIGLWGILEVTNLNYIKSHFSKD